MTPQTTGTLQIIGGALCWGLLGFLGATLNRAGFSGSEVASLRIMIAALVLPAARASVSTVFGLLTAVLPVALLLNEHLSGRQYAGIALIIGTALLNAPGAKQKLPKPFRRPLC